MAPTVFRIVTKESSVLSKYLVQVAVPIKYTPPGEKSLECVSTAGVFTATGVKFPYQKFCVNGLVPGDLLGIFYSLGTVNKEFL